MKSHFSAAELAELRLPGLPGTERNIRAMADRAGWTAQEVPARGRTGIRKEYAITALPEAARLALLNQQFSESTVHPTAGRISSAAGRPAASATTLAGQLSSITGDTLPAPVTLPVAESAPATGLSIPRSTAIAIKESGDLTSKQLDVERARDRLLAYIDQFPGSIHRAIDHLNAERYAGQLPLPLVWAFDHAWDKKRANARLTPKTVHNWKADKKARGRAAPKRVQKDMEVKPWYGLLLALRQRPQGSQYTWIKEQIHLQWNPAWGEDKPSYDAIRRVCVEKLSAIDQLKGRLTGSALRQHKHYIKRSSSGMYPFQEIHADGWNTHFTAPHPITGEFVTYEVWHFHDVATRYVPPPGIGLTETYEVVTAGLERAVRFGGMPAVLQTDSTKVVKNSPRFTADEFTALSERAGFVVVHPQEVGNSQANGICENFNHSWLDAQSRELATYQGAGMDGLTFKRVKKLTEKMVKAANAGDLVERDRYLKEAERMGKGRVFQSHDEAVQWINDTVERWNHKPHRSLPKITDLDTGKKRHQTPAEALQQHIDAGWEPVRLEDDQIVELFRPHVRCKVTREAISPIGNGQRYHHPMLGAWNNQYVMATIDPMDWRSVIVKELNGAVICEAPLSHVARGYRAQSLYEHAEEKRAAAQLKRLDDKAQKVRRRTGTYVPAAAEQVVIGGNVIDAAAISSIPMQIETIEPQGTSTAMDEATEATGEVFQEVAQISTPEPKDRSQMLPEDNYADWQEIDARILAGEEVGEEDAYWHESYQRTPQYRVMSGNGKAVA